MRNSILSLLVCALLCGFSARASGEQAGLHAKNELKRRLSQRVNVYDPPVTEGDEPVVVTLSVSLIDIVSADKSNNQLEFVAWSFFSWMDKKLQWDTAMYNVSSVSFRSNKFWTPDVVVYTQTAPADMIYPEVDLRVDSRGKVVYVPSRKFRVPCDLSNVDSQEGAECTIKFGSWAYSSLELNLKFSEGMEKMDLSYFFQGSKYDVIGNTAVRNEVHYDCCPETYVDLEYKLTIRSKDHEGGKGSSLFGWP